ncbi:hypothetical protein RQP46_004450 [Phenoliferia psychrophenolica]
MEEVEREERDEFESRLANLPRNPVFHNASDDSEDEGSFFSSWPPVAEAGGATKPARGRKIGPSSKAGRSKTHHSSKRRSDSPHDSIEVLTLSESDPDNDAPLPPPPKKRKQSKPPSTKLKKAATAPLASTSAAIAAPPRTKGGPKKRPSLNVVLERTAKLKGDKLRNAYPSISSFINHLNDHELDTSRGSIPNLFSDVQVTFTNNLYNPPNSLDDEIKNNIIRLLKFGATLVCPEDFVAPPPGAIEPGESEESIARKAEAGGWTTHVIPLQLQTDRNPFKFASIYPCLGSGLAGPHELGQFVKVVPYKWAMNSIAQGVRTPESIYSFEDDPFAPAPPPDKEKGSTSARKGKGRASDAAFDVSKKRKATTTLDTDDERSANENEEPEEGPERGISPFGPEDYPQGEKPPPNYFGPDELHPRKPGFDDLEAEMRLIRLCPEEYLDESEEVPDADMVYSARLADADFETDDEDNPPPVAAKSPRAKKPAGSRYACELSSKGGERTAGPNEFIAVVLDTLGKMIVHEPFRERGYRKAAGALRNCPDPIRTYSEALALKDVGKKIALKVVEIVKTGTHRRVGLRTDRDKAIERFKGVYGVGPKLAADFYDNGRRTVADLHLEKLTVPQQLGLQYYDDLAQRIPRDEVTQLFDIADMSCRITRDPTQDGKDHTGQIKKLQKALFDKGMMKYALTSPEDWDATDVKFNGLCQLPTGGLMRRIDILGVPWDELPAALIYFTFFNRSLRLKARHLGYRLNQRGLYKDVSRGPNGLKLTEGTRVDCKSEEEIFSKLGVAWRCVRSP